VHLDHQHGGRFLTVTHEQLSQTQCEVMHAESGGGPD
jgi:hypothetical protein